MEDIESSNKELIQRGMDILFPELREFIRKELGKEDWKERVYQAFHNPSELTYLNFEGNYDDFIDSLDMAACIKIITNMWLSTFKYCLPAKCRSLLNEVRDIRNEIAHPTAQNDKNQEDAERDLDTMSRLCIDIAPEAEPQIRSLYRQLRYGNAMGSIKGIPIAATKKDAKPSAVSISFEPQYSSLPSWREVIQPQKDVAEGNYKLAEFAADLGQVSKGQGREEYLDPVEFFNRTYLTEGIKSLLIQALKRFNGQDGNPVIQLKTAFGGGKTHSLLALYHMSRGRFSLQDTPELKNVIDDAGFSSLPHANIAVIVGTALDPSKKNRPTDFPGITINTLWGDIAAQIAQSAGRPDLYEIVREADKKGTAPGSDALKQLFDEAGPCLVLMDELVAYGRNIFGKTNLPGGTYESFLTFLQSLTEAATLSKNSMVVASLPESGKEAGGEEGGRVLEEVEHIFGRMESVWKPVSARESFEVVKRRLFSTYKNTEKIDIICNAYSKMYQDLDTKFPIEAKEAEYKERMRECYPIHPQVFDKLYGEWSTLEKFQRTRGVLRLMASVIHELWMNEDGNPIISMGSFPLVKNVKDELINYLPDSSAWNSIVDNEVYGKQSKPYSIDNNDKRLGLHRAATRLARTIFLGAPAARNQNVKGIKIEEIRLGVCQPNENITIFDDALNKLQNELSYLYSEDDRYWYDTRPTLKKLENDRASQLEETKLNGEIKERLRKFQPSYPFSKLHICPAGSGDIQDTNDGMRLVILRPEDGYSSAEKENCKAITQAKEILNNCEDNKPRKYKNTLVFLASDQSLDTLYDNARHYLAWKGIEADKDKLNLDASQMKNILSLVKNYDQKLKASLGSAYRWLLIPTIPEEGKESQDWEEYHLSDEEDLVSKAASYAKENDLIVEKWAPQLMEEVIRRYFWKDSNVNEVKIGFLWECIGSYLYLPKLADKSVLKDSIFEGINRHLFAISNGFKDGKYLNLQFSCREVYPADYLVEWESAEKQQPSAQEQNAGQSAPNALNSYEEKTDQAQEEEKLKTGFFMNVRLDKTHAVAVKEVKKYLEDIVDNLGDNCNINLIFSVEAQSDEGFSPEAIRTVTENLNALGIDRDKGYFD